MDEETPEESQSNELEALKAIYPDHFLNLNEGSSKWKPLNVILTVVPARENSGPFEVHAQVDLHVTASEHYPNMVPKIMLENAKGLSDKQLNHILNELEKIAKEKAKCGEVIIYELYNHIQAILTRYNKPPYKSFYEEMVSKQKERVEKEAELQKTEEDFERQLIKLEVEGIKEKRKKVRVHSVSSIEDEVSFPESSPRHRKRTTSCSSIEDERKSKNLANDQSFALINSESRLVNDFEILDFIGKGAFGDVLKVHHKLAGGLYAIKRIKVNLRNKQINKKIMREVKLLGSLNHENIVRYYFSWLEDLDSETHKYSKDTNHINNIDKKERKYDNKNFAGNLNLSFPHPGADTFSDDDDDGSDEDDEDDITWIEFRDITGNNNGTNITDSETPEPSLPIQQSRFQNKYLYILMEYCEKSTLRNAIDDNLYQDESRVWRLLREVLEGLSYIHQQGIIHRDLKPVNIFIDSDDHVKIGDFGLAIPHKPSTARLQTNHDTQNKENDDKEPDSPDASYTGRVGTALYVAPELNTTATKVHYNQKVDIYSLGIIFFEMCYRPFSTDMERHKTLMNLRCASRILFPDDFINKKTAQRQKVTLIRDLLQHNPADRPSASEILEKEYIPLAEEGNNNKKLHEIIHHTLKNPQTKVYKHLIAECFNQQLAVAEDITFDDVSPHSKTAWQHAFIEKIGDNAREVFRLHGGTFFSTPFLSPHNGIGIMDGGAVSLMTRSGSLINIPYDIRLSFARYLAQNPYVVHMKRYSMDKVFRERRMLGTHPKEIFECTFDVVSSSSSNLAVEAELISIIWEFLNKFSESLQKNCLIRLNHVSLVSAILCQHNIETKRHVQMCNILNKSKFQTDMARILSACCDRVSVNTVTSLMHAMNVEITPSKLRSHFENYMKKSSSYGAKECKFALSQLEMLIQYLTSLQIKCPIVIAPDVISNFHYYSGVMFQVVWDNKNKKRLEKDIIAAGGRYDNLIAQFRKALNKEKKTKQSAAGLTIYVDKLVSTLQINCQLFKTVDVLVCSVGQSEMMNEKLKIMKDLWAAEIRSTILDVDQSLEETQDYCEKMNVSHIVYVKESEPGIVRLKSWVKDRFYEKKLSLSEIVPYLNRVRHNSGGNCNTEAVVSNTGTYHYSRSESRSASVSQHENHQINITFIIDEKLNANNRRRYENQIYNIITNSLQKISYKSKIEVIALNAESELIKALVSVIDVNVKDNSYLSGLVKKFSRYKKCLNRVADRVEELLSGDKIPVIIFFSLRDSHFKILI